MTKSKIQIRRFFLLVIILIIGFLFRFNNLNWDENFHLHPDERFLTMVGTAMSIPKSFPEYIDPIKSRMNPKNIQYGFYVYGDFPLIFNKYLAVLFDKDNYNDYTVLGRQLSVFFDLLVIILIYKTARLLGDSSSSTSSPPQNHRIALCSAFIYAVSVLPIQLSHFFAVDTFLNFFMFASFYFVLRFWTQLRQGFLLRQDFGGQVDGQANQNDVILASGRSPRVQNLVFSAIFFGLAMASKITAIFILPLNLFFILTYSVRPSRIGKKILFLVIYLVVFYFILRLTSPYYFQTGNIFNPKPDPVFIENIKSLRNMTVKSLDNWFPPMVQWLNKNSVKHSLINNVVFGMGIVQTVFVLTGIVWIISKLPTSPRLPPSSRLRRTSRRASKTQNWIMFSILVWVTGFFVYESLQVTPTLRYFIFLYPFFAIFSGMGIVVILNSFQDLIKKRFRNKFGMTFIIIFNISISTTLLIWPLMFSSIYLHKNSRVEASEWIYKNLPDKSFILGESWDDSMPLSVIPNNNKSFLSDQLPVFDPDTPEKWQRMNDMLAKADYYVLSSNRGWGSITGVPEKYPKMSEFYRDLFDGSFCLKFICYKKIIEFTSYPALKFKILNFKFEITLPDDWSDEGFTVYDHPKVMIYEKI